MADYCDRCDKPLATDKLNDSPNHEGGCECEECLSHCWREYGGDCEFDKEFDWYNKYKEAILKLHALVSSRSDHGSIEANVKCITAAIINLKNPNL